MINDTRETVIEGGGYGGYGGYGGAGVGILLLVVVLIVLFAAFRRDGHDGGHGYGAGYGGACGGCYPKPSVSMVTEEMARIHHDQAVDTGKIIHDIDIQTCKIEKGQAEIIHNQDRLAAAAQQTFYSEKLADMREAKLCQEAKFLQQEALWANKLYQEQTANLINQQTCVLNNRLTHIEDKMLTAPKFSPLGCAPCTMSPCGPFPFNRERHDGCGCV